jgi:hypothetical protein
MATMVIAPGGYPSTQRYPGQTEEQPEASPLLTLADFAEHLNLRGGVPEEATKQKEMQRMLDGAIERIEAVCGPLQARQTTERIDVTRGTGLVDTWPVVRLVSARVAPRVWAPVGTPTAAVVAGVDQDGILHCQYGFTGTVLAVLEVGRSPVPQVLVEACLILAAHLYDTQRVTGSASGSGGDGVVLAGFAIPRRAAELMKPFLAPRVG